MTTAEDVLRLIWLVEQDDQLPVEVRERATRIRTGAAAKPELALERLGSLREATARGLALSEPEVSYARCISIDTFHNFAAADRAVADFIGPGDLERHLRSSEDPGAILMDLLLVDGIVTPAEYSWLLPYEPTIGLTGRDLKVTLNNRQDPPYAMLVLTLSSMSRAGVRVRQPNALDLIPSGHVQWVRGDVVGEVIDSDVHGSAVERIEWRP